MGRNRTVQGPGNGVSLSTHTVSIHKIDMNQATHTRNDWSATGANLFEALLTDPTNIRCVEIRSTFSTGNSERGTVGLRSDSNLYATWILLHTSDVRQNRFEDIVFWCPSGIKPNGWETYTSLPAGTGGDHGWKLDVRIWRKNSTQMMEGWVSNPSTAMDLDGNRIGSW